jgi:hypothetical protein
LSERTKIEIDNGVLFVASDGHYRPRSDAQKRVVAHGKNNLAAPGPSVAYTLKGRPVWPGAAG